MFGLVCQPPLDTLPILLYMALSPGSEYSSLCELNYSAQSATIGFSLPCNNTNCLLYTPNGLKGLRQNLKHTTHTSSKGLVQTVR